MSNEMAKRKTPLTPEEQYALAQQQESDLSRFQREYQLLARDHEVCTTEKLAKTKRLLKIYQKEHQNLSADLSVAKAPAKKKNDARISANLVELLDQHDHFAEKIQQKRQHILELNDQIKQVQTEVLNLRAKQETDKQYEDRIVVGQGVVEKLENKLDTQLKKFCTICTENIKLREQIDHLLVERVDFQKIWEKLILNLNIGKKFMLDLIEQATTACDQREEWCSKLQALRVKAHDDLLRHTQEMRDIKRRQDYEMKLEEFFQVKSQKRVMRDLIIKEAEKRRLLRDDMQLTLEKYQEMLCDIADFTEETLTDQICQKYLKQESANFAEFKYLNDLNEEIEHLNDNLGVLHLEIDEQNVIHENMSIQQETTLKVLEEKLDKVTNKADEASANLRKADTDLMGMMKSIEDLFKICGCDMDPLLQLLGDNGKICDYNVLFYQEILEKRIQEMLLHVYHDEETLINRKKLKPNERLLKDDKIRPKIYEIERVVATNPCPLCVEHELVSDVIDTLQHVMSRKRIKKKLDARLELPDGSERLHNVSACHLPKSREIIQKRYQ